jgi:fumarate hydratase class II
MLPVIARNLLESATLLATGCRALADKTVDGIEVDVEALRLAAERSPAVATGLNRYLGYDEVAAIVKQALAEGRTIREVTATRGHVAAGKLTQAELDEALDVDRLVGLT